MQWPYLIYGPFPNAVHCPITALYRKAKKLFFLFGSNSGSHFASRCPVSLGSNLEGSSDLLCLSVPWYSVKNTGQLLCRRCDVWCFLMISSLEHHMRRNMIPTWPTAGGVHLDHLIKVLSTTCLHVNDHFHSVMN